MSLQGLSQFLIFLRCQFMLLIVNNISGKDDDLFQDLSFSST
jgi:hypothetical protein